MASRVRRGRPRQSSPSSSELGGFFCSHSWHFHDIASRVRRGRPRQVVTKSGKPSSDPVSSLLIIRDFWAMSFAYIIESTSNRRWYYGSSSDPYERLDYHNKGWNRSTNGRGPWILIFLRKFETSAQAREFECLLKRQKRKAYILKKYASHFIAGRPGLPRRSVSRSRG